MPRPYASSIIDAPVHDVWGRIRDFNGMPQWHPGIADSRIENGEASDRVGCIRHFHTRDGGMIRSIFTRDKLPGAYDQAVADAIAAEELPFGDQVPTGTYLDMTANLPVVHPEKVLSPVLLVRGEYDGIATVADLEAFFNLLPNGDRQFVILPGTAHSVTLATNRQLFWHVARAFLDMPTPIAT